MEEEIAEEAAPQEQPPTAEEAFLNRLQPPEEEEPALEEEQPDAEEDLDDLLQDRQESTVVNPDTCRCLASRRALPLSPEGLNAALTRL